MFAIAVAISTVFYWRIFEPLATRIFANHDTTLDVDREKSPLKVRDVALIMDLEAPRNCWEVRVFVVPMMAEDFIHPTRKLIEFLGIIEVENWTNFTSGKACLQIEYWLLKFRKII